MWDGRALARVGSIIMVSFECRHQQHSLHSLCIVCAKSSASNTNLCCDCMQQNDGSCKKEKDGRFGLFISLAEYPIDAYAVFSICEQTIIILHQGDMYVCHLKLLIMCCTLTWCARR